MEIKISQDIRKFKTKDVGNFSFKEAGFIAVGSGVGYLTYKLTGSMEIAVFPALVILVFGFFKPYGMTFLQFLKTVVKENLTQQCYIYETDFEYDVDDIEEVYGKDDNVVIPTGWEVIQTSTPAKIKKEDKLRLIK